MAGLATRLAFRPYGCYSPNYEKNHFGTFAFGLYPARTGSSGQWSVSQGGTFNCRRIAVVPVTFF